MQKLLQPTQKEMQIQRNKKTKLHKKKRKYKEIKLQKKYKIQRNKKKKTCLWPLSLCTTTQRLRILIWTSLQRVDVERNIDHKTESELVEFIRITVEVGYGNARDNLACCGLAGARSLLMNNQLCDSLDRRKRLQKILLIACHVRQSQLKYDAIIMCALINGGNGLDHRQGEGIKSLYITTNEKKRSKIKIT